MNHKFCVAEVRKPRLGLSRKVSVIPEALSVYINQAVHKMKRRGDEIKVLSLGEAFFDMPVFSFEDIDFQKGYHYSESMGMLELRKIIAEYYFQRYQAVIRPENEILISAGSKPLIFMAFQAVLNPGDEVLIHEPAWLSYPEEIKLADGVPRFIPYHIPVSQFASYFTDKTKMLVINNPNNPAGKIYTQDELEQLYSMCRPRGIYVFVDEAYSDFVIGSKFTSMIHVVPDKDGIIVVNSLSKNLGMSGWRVGYVISSPDVIFNILKLNEHLITCPASVLLLYIIKYFDKLADAALPQAEKAVKKRGEVLKFMHQAGMKTLEGSATFYIFAGIGEYSHSSLDLGLYLLFRYHIAVVPGLAYGESTERFIRIGVGAEPLDELNESIKIIKKVIDTNEYDDALVERELKKLDMHCFAAGETGCE